MTLTLIALAFVGGYVASIFTWDRLHAVVIGLEQKAELLRDKARALEAKARALI